MKGKISITIGLPRSGKSSFANKWVRMPSIDGFPRTLVCPDDIRLAIVGERYNSYVEDYVHSITNTMLRATYNRGMHCLCDETNTTFKSIIARLYIDSELEVIWFPRRFDTSSQDFADHVMECKKRAISTNQSDLIPIIERMAANLMDLTVDFDNRLEAYRQKARLFKHTIVKD